MSQAKFGKLIDAHQVQVGRWERAEGQPTNRQLYRLVQVMRRYAPWLTVDWLIDPEMVEPVGSIQAQEQFDMEVIQLLIRDLGLVESRKRLIGVGRTLDQASVETSSQSPA